MTELQTAEKITAHRRESPLGLYIAFLRDHKLLNDSAQKKGFRQLVLSDGYEEFRDAIIDEWLSIKHSTAFQAASPPTTADIREAVKRRKETFAREDAAKDRAKATIQDRMVAISLSFVMPNGKMLRDCTGTECMEFSGWIAKIGMKAGIKRVGDVIKSDAQLRAALK